MMQEIDYAPRIIGRSLYPLTGGITKFPFQGHAENVTIGSFIMADSCSSCWSTDKSIRNCTFSYKEHQHLPDGEDCEECSDPWHGGATVAIADAVEYNSRWTDEICGECSKRRGEHMVAGDGCINAAGTRFKPTGRYMGGATGGGREAETSARGDK
jgi:hypothetical protein